MTSTSPTSASLVCYRKHAIELTPKKIQFVLSNCWVTPAQIAGNVIE